MSIQEEIKQFREKFVFRYRQGSNFVEIVHCSPDKLESFLYQALKRMQDGERERVLEIIDGMENPFDKCYEDEKFYAYNQALSELREKVKV